MDLRQPDGSVIELPTRKSRLLLAYLALPSGYAHAREKLAGLFWGETQDEQARGSLRNALTSLREGLGPNAIQADRDTVMLLPDRVIVDVDQLAEAAGKAAIVSDVEISQLYRGELLDGMSVTSQELDEWLTFERTRCRNLAQRAYERAIERLQGLGRAPDAIALAQRLLKLDPLREQSHRILMNVFEASGEKSKALEQFQRLKIS
jgi:DNA-binding SARP family transcriptional activator